MAHLRGGLFLAFYAVDGKRRKQRVSIPETRDGDCSKVVDAVKKILVDTHAVTANAIELYSIDPLHVTTRNGGKPWQAPDKPKDESAGGKGKKSTIPSKAGIRKMRKNDLLTLAKKRGVPGVSKEDKVDEIRTAVIRHLYNE